MENGDLSSDCWESGACVFWVHTGERAIRAHRLLTGLRLQRVEPTCKQKRAKVMG